MDIAPVSQSLTHARGTALPRLQHYTQGPMPAACGYIVDDVCSTTF